MRPATAGACRRRLHFRTVLRLGLALAVAALLVCGSAQGGVPVRAGACVHRPELGRRHDARRPRRGRPAPDGEHHEADDRARRARASLTRRRGHRPRGRRSGRRVVDRPSRRAADVRARPARRALVPSANDAATALAVAAGGSEPRFVALMNRKARELGLTGTHYRNPHGLDEPGHVSTARDIAVLLRDALRVPVIRRYAGMSRATLSDGRVVESTDNLLGRFGGVVGGKTGHTANAGWSQAALARRGGVAITAVVLDSPSEAQRDTDLAALLRLRPGELPVGEGRRPCADVCGDPRRVGPAAGSRRRAAGDRPSHLDRPAARPSGWSCRSVAALPVVAGQRLGTVVVRTAPASSRARRSWRRRRGRRRACPRRRGG